MGPGPDVRNLEKRSRRDMWLSEGWGRDVRGECVVGLVYCVFFSKEKRVKVW